MTRRQAITAYMLGQIGMGAAMLAVVATVHDGLEATAYITAIALLSIAATGIYAATHALSPPELADVGERSLVGHYDPDGAFVVDGYVYRAPFATEAAADAAKAAVRDLKDAGIPANGYPPTLRRPTTRRGRRA